MPGTVAQLFRNRPLLSLRESLISKSNLCPKHRETRETQIRICRILGFYENQHNAPRNFMNPSYGLRTEKQADGKTIKSPNYNTLGASHSFRSGE